VTKCSMLMMVYFSSYESGKATGHCRSQFFFFQAEDGIRDGHVTGVQTCALPICRSAKATTEPLTSPDRPGRPSLRANVAEGFSRSEERRVGKECRSGWSPNDEKKKRWGCGKYPRSSREEEGALT